MGNQKKFRLFETPRYLPGSVPKSVWLLDLKLYNLHRLSIFTCIAKVDTSPPKMNPSNYLKTKKLVDDSLRINQIDLENKDILKKINIINRTKGRIDCWNEYAYLGTSKWVSQHKKMMKIAQANKSIYTRIVMADSLYRRSGMLRNWTEVVRKLQYSSRYPLVILQKKSVDQQIIEEPSISNDLEKLCVRPMVYMDFEVLHGVKLGRIVIVLYNDYAPVTCQNFLAIVNGEDGLTYKNCVIHNVVKGQYIVTGDITKGNGKGGLSIYGDKFAEESHTLLHSKAGVLSMVRVGDKENNSQFSITLAAMPKLDGKQVVFGKVVKGNATIFQVEDLGRKIGKPVVPIIIKKCGEYLHKHSKNK